MIKNILTSALLLIAVCSYGQTGKAVGIISTDTTIPNDFPHPSSILDVHAETKGFLGPRVALTSLTSRTPITTTTTTTITADLKPGLLVYNTNATIGKGYYYWSGLSWIPWQKSSNTIQNYAITDISTSTLGYVPEGSMATAPAEYVYGNIKATKAGCYKFTTGNNHSFCGYSLTDNTTNAAVGTNWTTAFTIAKNLNGYMATITSTEEWDFVKNNLLSTSLPSQNQNNVWLGFNKITYPGNPQKFTWITGEVSMVAWERAGITTAPYYKNSSFEFNFDVNQPDNNGGTEGCAHISATSKSSTRLWYDTNCNNTTIDTKPVSYLIVEYQN